MMDSPAMDTLLWVAWGAALFILAVTLLKGKV